MRRIPIVHDDNRAPSRSDELHRLATLLREGRRVSDSTDALTMQDPEGHILAWSRGAERLYGFSELEARRMNIRDLVPDEHATQIPGIVEAVKRGDIPGLEVRRKAKDGRVLDVWVTTTRLLDRKGRVVAVSTTEHDITERKQSQATFRRLAIVLRDSNDAITMQDLEGHILAWNHGAERMYGYSEHEALRMNIETLVPEEGRPGARALLEAVKRGEEPTSLEVLRKTKDGRVLSVWLTTTKLASDVGHPVAVVTTERDITERKRFEEDREKLLRQLRDALEARDEFLSIASHELRTPITALNLKLELLLRELGRGDSDTRKLAARLEMATRQTRRLTRLVDELLDVSRIATGRLKLEHERVDLSLLTQDVLARHREVIDRGNCSVTVRVEPTVVGNWDRMRLEQVLVNLLTNAVKYGAGSPIEVELHADDHQAILIVRDHGPGISERDQRRIFERFARLAPRGVGGLGLGLYIARTIVEAHRGRIRVESRQGQGATFVVELPLDPPQPEVEAE